MLKLKGTEKSLIYQNVLDVEFYCNGKVISIELRITKSLRY